MDFIAKRISPHLARPGSGFWGFITRKILGANQPIEEETYKILAVKPGENVLELGFGYGTGIDYALKNGLRESSGTLYGVDYSSTVCEAVSKEFHADIECGKLKILNENVANMSIEDSLFDKVFHTNCYYFWPNMSAAAAEINRVMKPGGLIVTGLDMKRVQASIEKGGLTESQTQPQRYMDAMSAAGFINVREETKYDEERKLNFTFLFATKPQ